MATRRQDTKYWQGWKEALACLETRLELIQKEINSHSKPQDLVLDIRLQINELKAIHADLTFTE